MFSGSIECLPILQFCSCITIRGHFEHFDSNVWVALQILTSNIVILSKPFLSLSLSFFSLSLSFFLWEKASQSRLVCFRKHPFSNIPVSFVFLSSFTLPLPRNKFAQSWNVASRVENVEKECTFWKKERKRKWNVTSHVLFSPFLFHSFQGFHLLLFRLNSFSPWNFLCFQLYVSLTLVKRRELKSWVWERKNEE